MELCAYLADDTQIKQLEADSQLLKFYWNSEDNTLIN